MAIGRRSNGQMGEGLSSRYILRKETPPPTFGDCAEAFYGQRVHRDYFPIEKLVAARERYDAIIRTFWRRFLPQPFPAVLEIGSENVSNAEYLIHEMGIDRSQYVVVDVSPPVVDSMLAAGLRAVRLDISQDRIPFESATFDVVIISEVLEHLVNPDHALRELHRVLRMPESILIGTTPNLCSWFNRFLLLMGKQPIFTETGTEWNFGRSPFFHRSRPVGHLRVFTCQSVRELLNYHGFTGVEIEGVAFPSNIHLPRALRGIDKVFSGSPNLAAEVLFAANKGESRQSQVPS